MIIREYTVVAALNPKTLEDEVNKMINDGWQPIGGIAVLAAPTNQTKQDFILQGAYFNQAMGR